MKKKLQLDEFCKFCEHAAPLADADAVLCEKKGVVSASFHCRRFRYDPLKREPGTVRSAVSLDFVPLDDTLPENDDKE